jgi:hypothetical protein
LALAAAIAGGGLPLAAVADCPPAPVRLLVADPAADDQLGRNVALDGDLAVVGARLDDDNGVDSGSVYVFRRQAAGTWTQEAKLLASDGQAGDRFGSAVAVSGDFALVGAPWDDDRGLDAGAAYLFFRDSQGGWTQVAKLLADDGQAADSFGAAVDVDGDAAVVGALLEDERGLNAGAAYVFRRSNDGTWTQEQKLLAGDGAATDFFGAAVAISGDRAAIGAYQDDDTGADSGAAYVFFRDAGGTWIEDAKLIASDGEAGDYFGESVDVAGGTLVAGARHDAPHGAGSGSAYVFQRDAAGWSQAAKLVPNDGAAGNEFGYGVAVAGSMVIAGARKDNDLGSQSGSAYVFAPDAAGSWTQRAKLYGSDEAAGDNFGGSVAMDGSRAVVGSYAKDDPANNAGAAYALELACLLPCPGDLDASGRVDLADLSALLTNFGGASGADPGDGDLDGDGDVDLADLSGLLTVFGSSCD